MFVVYSAVFFYVVILLMLLALVQFLNNLNNLCLIEVLCHRYLLNFISYIKSGPKVCIQYSILYSIDGSVYVL